MLSTKLVNAINYQGTLDDALQGTRHELEAARKRIDELEAAAKAQNDMIRTGLLVQRSEVDPVLNKLKADLHEACKQRDSADKGKKQMEVELENLTSALFEEANTMVAAARRDTEAMERKNSQLRSQLNDTELLLASQQEQLQDLKGVMERMSSERDENETTAQMSTAPSTPGVDNANKMSRILDALPLSPNPLGAGDIAPDHPLHFAHLLSPVMRTDVQAYIDFTDLLKSARPPGGHSRNVSNSNISSINGVGAMSAPSAASSSPHLPGSFGYGASSPRDSSFSSATPALKDSKFYKRSLAEDIEPTMRLDIAPGLSWLARRTVLSSLTAGTLVVEPFAPQSKFYGNVYACSLCGENRRSDAHARRHRFRTSEDESAQRYPLCEYCLGRVRATGDFMGFLRMVREGLWRANTEEDVKNAWEESVRLREKMFWARLGGGVVPVLHRGETPITALRHSEAFGRNSTDTGSSRPQTRSKEDSATLEVPKIEDPFRTAQSNSDPEKSEVQDFGAAKKPATPEPEKRPQTPPNAEQHAGADMSGEERTASEPADETRPPPLELGDGIDSSDRKIEPPLPSPLAEAGASPLDDDDDEKDDDKRDSTIPGSFD